jgi:hypothetical protein
MRDIVKRLEAQRDHADDWRTLLCEEAAKEIERLERELSVALEEIARLQQQNNHLVQTAQGRVSAELHKAALQEKQAEVDRLRTEEVSLTRRVGRLRLALEAIAHKGGETNAHGYALQQIAREALKNEAHE